MRRRPTVVLSANTSWYLYNFRASTIRALRDRGYEVTCISPPDDYSDKLESDLGSSWQPLKMNNQGHNPAHDVRLFLQFLRYYRKLRPVAVCHFTIKNNIYGTWAAKLLGVPAFNNVSGLGTAFIREGPVATVVRVLYRISQPFAHKIYCQNEDDARQLVENKLVPADRVEVLPGSGVDLNRFRPTLRVARDGAPFRFLYAGRMLADKGLRELRSAMQMINQSGQRCELWLSGFTGVENVSAFSDTELLEWAQEPGVKWLGPSDCMEKIYAQVDCVVLPSYREGLPRSLLEAGAMGLPVIATNVPGCRTVVKHDYNGLLCEAKNGKSLATTMQEMLALSKKKRREMGANGRQQVVDNYDERCVVEATLHGIESLQR